MEQIYYSEASEKGGYDIVRRNNQGFLVPIKGEHYQTEQEAIERARKLNKAYHAKNQN